MNREIKFRAWRKEFDGNKAQMFPDDEKGYLFAHAIQNPETYSLMQFTGLKDKNGREIYEGDILKSLAGISMVVKFCDGTFEASNGQIGIDRYAWRDREVVGNIHENPELVGRPQ